MRNVNQEAGQEYQADKSQAGQYNNMASQDRAMLMNQNRNAINNPTGLNANQQHQALTAAEAGAGGATGSLAGAAGLAANRTRNSGALAGTMDSLARSRAEAAAKGSEGIANQSNMLAQQNKQNALKSLGGIYGQDVGAGIKQGEMGNAALNTQLAANKTGWFQNMTDFMNAARKWRQGRSSVKTAF